MLQMLYMYTNMWTEIRAWFICWSSRGQQLSHQRWIWGINCNAGFETQSRCHQKSKIGGISDPQNRLVSSKILKYKKINKNQRLSTPLQYFLLLVMKAQFCEIGPLDIITIVRATYRFKLTFYPDKTGISTGATIAVLRLWGRENYVL